MNAREFFDAVRKMRHLQREYFRLQRSTASQGEKRAALIEAQHAERAIDAEIERVQSVLSNNPMLP